MSVRVAACPHCAQPAEQPIVCTRCGWRWYANPKPAAGTLVERRDGDPAQPSALLLRRAIEPGAGGWDLPAGFLDPGESPEEAALRETREEAGLDVRLIRLLGVYTSRPANAVTTIYLASAHDPNDPVTLDTESDDHAWVSRSSVAAWIPRMAFGSMASALADWADDRFGMPHTE